MSFSIYAVAVPGILQALANLSGVLGKGEAFCTERKIEPEILINARLFPDMFPLSRQVQIAADTAKGMAARLGQVAIPSFPDTETSFSELRARIDKTVEFIKTVAPDKIVGAEDREVVMKIGQREVRFTGQTYLANFVLPNFYFHSSMTYAILRHNGVPVGKADFLGGI
ncbi:MAG TPA: DUF1993 domain-containing protein [Dongiaceae bacterium]|nr:DUF1993 domain-containing protein [Dongiaceae bacterium]